MLCIGTVSRLYEKNYTVSYEEPEPLWILVVVGALLRRTLSSLPVAGVNVLISNTSGAKLHIRIF